MNSPDPKEAEIVVAALELPDDATRAAFLADACEGDAALRARIEAQLEVRLREGALLSTPTLVTPPDKTVFTKESSPAAQPVPGDKVRYFGDYELVEEIARGGMGVVWKARQISLNRPVALKMILAGKFAGEDEVKRFRTEAEAAANLDHPNIVPIYEVGEQNGQNYFSMKFVEGPSLAKVLARNQRPQKEKPEAGRAGSPLPADGAHGVTRPTSQRRERGGEPLGLDLSDLKVAASLLAKVARAVHHAHQRGVLHRDLKPGNILIDELGEPHVTDFGLAKLVHADSGLTQTNAVMGTPSYMAPEQAAGRLKQLSTAADIFSLGVILYQLLTGKLPFGGETPMEVMRQVMEQEPARPSTVTRAVDRDLETICLKCLEKETSARYGSAEALAEELERWLRHEPILARPASGSERLVKWIKRRPAVAALSATTVVVALVGIVSVLWQWNEAVKAHQKADENADQSRLNARRAESQRVKAEQERQRADENARQSQLNAKRADFQREQAEIGRTNLYRSLYIEHMSLAKRAWDEVRVDRAVELLDLHRPQPGRPDLRGFEWFYLHRLCHSDLLTLTGHIGAVTSVAFGPDGKRLASASLDRTVKVWDVTSGRETLTLKGHTDSVLSVAFSADGQRLASASLDRMVKVWDAMTGQETLTLQGHTGAVWSVAFSPDGKRLASASSDKTVKVWDATSGQETLTLQGHTGDIKVFSEGTIVGTNIYPKFLTVAIKSVAFSGDGNRLASAGDDGTMNVWDLSAGQASATSGQKTLTLRGSTTVAFSPDGKRLASRSGDKTVKVWDATSGTELLTLKGHTYGVASVAFSPDGKRLASASYDQTVKVWDATSGQEMLTLKGHIGLVMSVAFSADGQRLASGSDDQTVKVWDATIGQEALTLKGRIGAVLSMVFSPDGKRLASASSYMVKVWDATSGQETLTLKGHTSNVTSVAFSANGKRLASASDDQTVKVWDATNGQETLTLKGHTRPVMSVAFSADGKRLASASSDKTMKVWDVTSGQEMATLMLNGYTGLVESMAFSADGKRLASGSRDQTVKVWDATTGREMLTLKGHAGPVMSVAFSADGTRLASASWEKTVKIWNATTGQQTLTLHGHTSLVMSVAFSPDGKQLASSSADRTVKVWDATSGQETLTLNGEPHTQELTHVAFSPDGKRLASASSGDGRVKIWDATPRSPATVQAPATK